MGMFEEKVTHFKQRKAEILAMDSKVSALRDAAQAEIRAFAEKKNAELEEPTRELEHETEKYRAELKATFGITDGEPIMVLDVVEAIRKIQSM